MSLRAKIITYLILLHLVLAVAAVVVFYDNRVWLLAVEACFVLSILLGIRLVRAFFVPLEMIRTGAELINEGDFTSKFVKVGQPEIDQLVAVYNRMIDQLREERTLVQEQHYFMDKILKTSPSGVVIFDFDGLISLVNPPAEEILAREHDHLKGKKLEELKTPFTDELASLKEGTAKILRLRGNRRLRCQVSHFQNHGFPRVFIMMEELTEELRLSEKAAYEQLVRMMSHEVNNSIGAITSLLHSCFVYGDQLVEDDQADYRRALETAIAGAETLNSFMKRFAEVVRLPEPEKRSCNIQQLLEDIQTLLAPEIRRRRIAWNWDIKTPLVSLQVDKNQMEQALLNIFRNSIEAIGTDGSITIRTERNGQRQSVSIEDTGTGMSDADHAKLFVPFFTTKASGQGVGLTLVQEILVRHGIEFSLESQPGGPTLFTMTFPD